MVVDLEYYGKRKFSNILDIYEWSKEWDKVCKELKKTKKDLSKIFITKKEVQ